MGREAGVAAADDADIGGVRADQGLDPLGGRLGSERLLEPERPDSGDVDGLKADHVELRSRTATTPQS